jgi:DNA-directed RNA polymerase specialized sigma24 family protein
MTVSSTSRSAGEERSAGPPAFDPTPFWNWVERTAAGHLPPHLSDQSQRARVAVHLLHDRMAEAEKQRHFLPSLHKAVAAAAAEAGARAPGAEPAGRRDPNVFWAHARRYMESHFARDPEVREDLSAEALVKLSRAFVSQQEKGKPVENPEALMTLIANATRVDYVRRVTRWRILLRPLAEDAPDPADPGPLPDELPAGDPLETRWWAVRQRFATRYESPSCLEILDRMLEGRTHKEIGAEFSKEPNTITQRWKRCCEDARAHIEKEPQ